jgi:hypothetical protein
VLSIGYLVIAVVDFAVLVWAARLCLQYRTNGLIFASIPLTLLWYDNFVIGIGSTLGQGDLLVQLNYVRFVAHYVGLPMTFIALGAMAREAGFPWARHRLVMGAFCTLATGFIAHDLWLLSQSTFYPSCFADTLRYTTHIASYTACGADADIGAGRSIAPVPAITLTNMLILFGIYLWIRIGWKWLALGSVGALVFFAVPYAQTGGILGNVGEPIISIVIVATAAHIARTRRG